MIATIAEEKKLNSVLTALNQETAQQYADAVCSFQKASQSTSVVSPVKLIAHHLANIQKDHPKEYADGIARFNSGD